MTGTTRSSSSATSGRVAPGRVDSPPMSSRSAPCVAQLEAVRDRGVGGPVEPAVGERVGRDVDDAHHQGPRQRRQPGAPRLQVAHRWRHRRAR